ncbi:hypothetical protein AAC387_Pa06g0705 [Persea americana]
MLLSTVELIFSQFRHLTIGILNLVWQMSMRRVSRKTRRGDEENSDDPNCAESDDELRKRVEQYIEKINRRWKAEKVQGRLVQCQWCEHLQC